MTQDRKQVLLILLFFGLIYFALFLWPNATGARDVAMISVFEVDESAQYAHPIRMLTPGDSAIASLRRFISYQHYYYGYPFYLASALALLPLKLTVGLGNTALNMLVLRQAISVLPIILAVLVLVYIQTRFQSLIGSLALLLFLLAVPAVFANSAWWHPDSLTVLWIALTFFFLDRDDLRFGRDYTLAALFCGLTTATKLVGLFFFLAIPLYLGLGLLRKRLTPASAVRKAILFVAVMALTFLLANPFLFDATQRQRAWQIQTRQAQAMSQGWNVLYAKGPLSWLPVIREHYGSLTFNALAFLAAGWAARKTRRPIYLLVLAWAIPYLLYVLFRIVIKPAHFLLPVALPLYSCLGALFLACPDLRRLRGLPARAALPRLLLVALAAGIVVWQAVYNLRQDVDHYRTSSRRELDSPEIGFYTELRASYLDALAPDRPLTVYRDLRTYFPPQGKWKVVTNFQPVNYAWIQDREVDLIVMWNQRILDYSQEGILDMALDRNEMELISRFYSDMRAGAPEGFRLLTRSECCSAFIREGIDPGG